MTSLSHYPGFLPLHVVKGDTSSPSTGLASPGAIYGLNTYHWGQRSRVAWCNLQGQEQGGCWKVARGRVKGLGC